MPKRRAMESISPRSRTARSPTPPPELRSAIAAQLRGIMNTPTEHDYRNYPQGYFWQWYKGRHWTLQKDTWWTIDFHDIDSRTESWRPELMVASNGMLVTRSWRWAAGWTNTYGVHQPEEHMPWASTEQSATGEIEAHQLPIVGHRAVQQ